MRTIYPPDHPLRSAYLKLRRAKVHIDGLDRRVRNFKAACPNPTLSEESDPDGNLYQALTFNGPLAPDSWGAIWGDVVGDLRDSLDHLAWQMRIPDPLSEHEERAIQFPLFDTSLGWQEFLKRTQRRGKPQGLGLFQARFHDAIETFQPYNRTKWPELERLAVLNKLANVDKHRVVIPVIPTTNLSLTPGMSIGLPLRLDQGGPIMFSAVVGTWKMRDPFDPHFSVDVGFSIATQGAIVAVAIHRVGHLIDIHNFIRDEVFPKFARVFP